MSCRCIFVYHLDVHLVHVYNAVILGLLLLYFSEILTVAPFFVEKVIWGNFGRFILTLHMLVPRRTSLSPGSLSSPVSLDGCLISWRYLVRYVLPVPYFGTAKFADRRGLS